MSVIKYRDSDGKMKPIPTIKGEDGKSAYQYAVDGGYTGTEEEFTQKMGQQVVPDWNENNPDSPSYIKNRFGGYVDEKEVLLYSGTKTLDSADDNPTFDSNLNISLVVGDHYRIVYDGTEFNTVCKQNHGDLYVGARPSAGLPDTENCSNAPFRITTYNNNDSGVLVFDRGEHTLELYHTETGPIKIPKEYLDMDVVGVYFTYDNVSKTYKSSMSAEEIRNRLNENIVGFYQDGPDGMDGKWRRLTFTPKIESNRIGYASKLSFIGIKPYNNYLFVIEFVLNGADTVERFSYNLPTFSTDGKVNFIDKDGHLISKRILDTPDWDADSLSSSFIQNRPCYKERYENIQIGNNVRVNSTTTVLNLWMVYGLGNISSDKISEITRTNQITLLQNSYSIERKSKSYLIGDAFTQLPLSFYSVQHTFKLGEMKTDVPVTISMLCYNIDVENSQFFAESDCQNFYNVKLKSQGDIGFVLITNVDGGYGSEALSQYAFAVFSNPYDSTSYTPVTRSLTNPYVVQTLDAEYLPEGIVSTATEPEEDELLQEVFG